MPSVHILWEVTAETIFFWLPCMHAAELAEKVNLPSLNFFWLFWGEKWVGHLGVEPCQSVFVAGWCAPVQLLCQCAPSWWELWVGCSLLLVLLLIYWYSLTLYPRLASISSWSPGQPWLCLTASPTADPQMLGFRYAWQCLTPLHFFLNLLFWFFLYPCSFVIILFV